MSAQFEFTAAVWRYSGNGGWHFVTLPKDLSASIRTIAGGLMNAFGSLRVVARLGGASWKTSLFFDTKAAAFVLPLKADVRRQEKICDGDCVRVAVEIEL